MCCCDKEIQNLVTKLVSCINHKDLTNNTDSVHVVFDNQIPLIHSIPTDMIGLFNDFSKHIINTLSGIHYRHKSIYNAILDIDTYNELVIKGNDCFLINSISTVTDTNVNPLLNYFYWLSYSIKNMMNTNIDLCEYLEYNDTVDEYGVINALSGSIDALIGMEPSGCYPDRFMIGCDNDGVCHYVLRDDVSNTTYYRYCLDTTVHNNNMCVLNKDIVTDIFKELEHITKIMPSLIMSVIEVVGVLENHKKGCDEYITDLTLFSTEYIRYVYKYICLNTQLINRLYELSR